jgi:hypothetical protein
MPLRGRPLHPPPPPSTHPTRVGKSAHKRGIDFPLGLGVIAEFRGQFSCGDGTEARRPDSAPLVCATPGDSSDSLLCVSLPPSPSPSLPFSAEKARGEARRGAARA